MNNSKKKWITITVALLIVTNLITFAVTDLVSFNIPNGKVSLSKQDYENYNKFSKLFAVRDRLYKYYDGTLDDTALEEGAIKGMTEAVNDPYTVFMNKKEYTDFSVNTTGNYSGIGVEVGVKDDNLVVMTVFDGSPSKKAGLLTGDIIEAIGTTAVTGNDLDKASNMMRGAEGTSVTITLKRQGKGEFQVTIKRAKITLQTVTGKMLKNSNIGYIQIAEFDDNTSAQFNKELVVLKNQNMKGLILDLRGNPGGILQECVKVASNFIPKDKVVVSTIDKYNNKTEYKSVGGNFIGLPMVVLVDGGTASASEIVSGAIRDYKIGTLIGVKTFGKGIVQSILDDSFGGLGDGSGLKITTAKYYTPNGENIHKKGINPDIVVEYPAALKEKTYSEDTDPQYQKALQVIKQKMSSK